MLLSLTLWLGRRVGWADENAKIPLHLQARILRTPSPDAEPLKDIGSKMLISKP